MNTHVAFLEGYEQFEYLVVTAVEPVELAVAVGLDFVVVAVLHLAMMRMDSEVLRQSNDLNDSNVHL